MPLQTALPTLKRQFTQYLEKAAYEAFMTSIEVPEGTPYEIKRKIEEDGRRSAQKFAKKFKEECAEQLAQSIHDYVKQIAIQATPSGSLISTSIYSPSPCVGTIPPNDFRVF